MPKAAFITCRSKEYRETQDEVERHPSIEVGTGNNLNIQSVGGEEEIQTSARHSMPSKYLVSISQTREFPPDLRAACGICILYVRRYTSISTC